MRSVDSDVKNIQVIDGAMNYTFSIFQATDEEFVLFFPEPGQEIQFAEDLHLPRQARDRSFSRSSECSAAPIFRHLKGRSGRLLAHRVAARLSAFRLLLPRSVGAATRYPTETLDAKFAVMHNSARAIARVIPDSGWLKPGFGARRRKLGPSSLLLSSPMKRAGRAKVWLRLFRKWAAVVFRRPV